MCLLLFVFSTSHFDLHFRPVNISWCIFILSSFCIVPQSVEMIHTVWSRNYDDFGFTRSDSRIYRGKERVSNMIRNKGKFIQKKNVERHTSNCRCRGRCCQILDPFSNSSDPRFHTNTPCCIHFGRFSYAVCSLPNNSLAVAYFVCQYTNIYTIIKHSIMK